LSYFLIFELLHSTFDSYNAGLITGIFLFGFPSSSGRAFIPEAGFNLVPIQIPDKAAVVSLTVMRPRTGRAFIDGTGQQRLAMEFIHLLLTGGEKTDVRTVAG
jgi:hypothetical protein